MGEWSEAEPMLTLGMTNDRPFGDADVVPYHSELHPEPFEGTTQGSDNNDSE